MKKIKRHKLPNLPRQWQKLLLWSGVVWFMMASMMFPSSVLAVDTLAAKHLVTGKISVAEDGDMASPQQFNAAAIGQELLQKLDESDAIPLMDAAELEQFLQKILEITHSSALLSGLDAANGNTSAAYLDDCVGSYHGPEKEIWLLQMRLVSDRSYQFLQPYAEAELPSRQVRGVILSLLDSDGADEETLQQITAWFEKLDVPLVILIDHTTKGTAEKLSATLQQNGAFLVGEQLPKNLQDSQVVILSTGQKLLLPVLTQQQGNKNKMIPDLVLKKNGRNKPGNVPKEWLQKAVDFLIVKNALEK